MVSIYKTEKVREGNYVTMSLRGLSTDSKPTTLDLNIVDNGSEFIEIDTGDVYMYDLDNTTWYKTSGNGGGSMEKYDYIIPTISFDPADTNYLITDTDISDMLDEISSRLDTEFEPLLIGGYLHNEDGGEDEFVVFSYAFSHDGNKVILNGVSYSFGYILISNTANGWNAYHSNL